MSVHVLRSAGVFLAAMLLMNIGGCRNYITPEQGAIAKEEARISIAESLAGENEFKQDDIKITYTLIEQEESVKFSARIDLKRSLTDSFPVVKTFHVKLSLLDNNGSVLETVDISPFYSVNDRIAQSLKVSRDFIRPSGATSFVFNYYGVFEGHKPDISEDWDLFYFPFE